MFDYEKKTRSFYKDDEKAHRYHQAFTGQKGLKGARFRFIAGRERRAVHMLLCRLGAKRTIDIPAGTGKMAGVFREQGCEVLACDISENMLDIARETYRAHGPERVSFRIVDLERATEKIPERYDVTVCVRLMHRVPDGEKRRMLRQIAILTPWAIVSFGVDSSWQRVRQKVRRGLIGGEDIGVETRPTRRELEALVGEFFDIERRIPVVRTLSAEWMYLLRSKGGSERSG